MTHTSLQVAVKFCENTPIGSASIIDFVILNLLVLKIDEASDEANFERLDIDCILPEDSKRFLWIGIAIKELSDKLETNRFELLRIYSLIVSFFK